MATPTNWPRPRTSTSGSTFPETSQGHQGSPAELVNPGVLAVENLGLAGPGERFFHGLSASRDTGFGQFQIFLRRGRAVDQRLDVAEHAWGVHFFAQFFEEWAEFGVEEKHFAAKAGFEEQLGAHRAADGQRGGHFPVAPDLAQPVVLLASEVGTELDNFFRALRPELGEPPVAGLAHFGFAAQVVQLEDNFSVSGSRLVSHEDLRWNREFACGKPGREITAFD